MGLSSKLMQYISNFIEIYLSQILGNGKKKKKTNMNIKELKCN